MSTSRVREWIDSTPLVTRVVIFLCVALFVYSSLKPDVIGTACIQANAVWAHHQVYRVVLAPFFHGGALHILFNMMSYHPMGRSLEPVLGSFLFFYLIAQFVLVSNLFYIILATFVLPSYQFQCAIGFSGVIFGLIVVQSQRSGESHQSIFGLVSVPLKWYPWALLVLIQVIMPNVSFLGHLCGILVGYLYTMGILMMFTPSVATIHKIEGSALVSWIVRIPGYRLIQQETSGVLATGSQNSNNETDSLWKRFTRLFRWPSAVTEAFPGRGVTLGGGGGGGGGGSSGGRYERIPVIAGENDVEMGGHEPEPAPAPAPEPKPELEPVPETRPMPNPWTPSERTAPYDNL